MVVTAPDRPKSRMMARPMTKGGVMIGNTVSARNDLVLTRTQDQRRERLSTTRDPVLLEVFNNLFMAIAEQMGEALRATAQSVNIKERLDFSCALFDATGELVANAPHLPVHMGSMDRSVESVIAAAGTTMRPGDVYMINAPYNLSLIHI